MTTRVDKNKYPRFYLESESGRWNWRKDGEYRFEINTGNIAVFRSQNAFKAIVKGLMWYIGFRYRLWKKH